MAASSATVRKHSVVLAGHRTSVSLEDAFWEVLQTLARADGRSVNDLIAEIDRDRSGNLSSAIRIYVLGRVRDMGGADASVL